MRGGETGGRGFTRPLPRGEEAVLRIMRRGWLPQERRGQRGREQRATRGSLRLALVALVCPSATARPTSVQRGSTRLLATIILVRRGTQCMHGEESKSSCIHLNFGVRNICLWEAAPVCRCSEVEARCAFFGIAVVEGAWTCALWSYVSACLGREHRSRAAAGTHRTA